MNLYLSSGYFDFEKIRTFCEEHGIAFCYIVGGRGTGKTYGAIDSYLFNRPAPFMWLRRTQAQVDIINKPEFNPFKKNAAAHDTEICMATISQYNAGIYRAFESGDKLMPDGPALGYTGALSTFSNIRGFDASDLEAIIWDEFIPESHERPIKDEAGAFFNAYETINRNRELNGQRPVIAFCLANSNDIGNPVFLAAGHVQTCLNMRKKEQDVFIDFDRHYMIILLDESPISKEKENTAIYTYLKGTRNTFSEMSLSNVFHGEKDIRVKSRPLGEYASLVTVGELTIYKHKGGQLPHFVSFHKSGAGPVYGSSETELKRFASKYTYLWLAYMRDRIEFEDHGAELLFRQYFK